MKPSANSLALKRNPEVGDLHPQSSQWRVVNVRIMDGADIEGKIVYSGPNQQRMVETFVLKSVA